jgi:hypothetical protein
MPHLILTPLSFSPSRRRPVPLQEGPRGLQHQGRGLRVQAPLRLLKGQGESIAQQTGSSCTFWKIFTQPRASAPSNSLPAAPYFKSNNARISAICDDQYSSTLAMPEETAGEAFKVNMTRKTQGWFRRWGSPCLSDATSPGPGAAPGGAGSGAGAATLAPPAPAVSDDEEGSDLITGGIRRCHQLCPW